MCELRTQKQKEERELDFEFLMLNLKEILPEERKAFQKKVSETKRINYIILSNWIIQDERFKKVYNNPENLTLFQKKKIVDELVTEEQNKALEENFLDVTVNTTQSMELKQDFNNCGQAVQLCIEKKDYDILINWIRIWRKIALKANNTNVIVGQSNIYRQEQFQEVFKQLLELIIYELREIYPNKNKYELTVELREWIFLPKNKRNRNILKDKKNLLTALEETEIFIGKEFAESIANKQLR